MKRFLITCLAALTLSAGAWAQAGDCPRGNGNGKGPRCGQRGDCPQGKGDPANCPNPECPKKAGGNTQQGPRR